MSDETRALIAEARRYRRTVSRERSLLHRLADALEAAHAAPAGDDREALIREMRNAEVFFNDADGVWEQPTLGEAERIADVALAVGFARAPRGFDCGDNGAGVSNSAQTEAAQVPATDDDEPNEYTTDEYVAAIRAAVVDIAEMHPGRGCIGCQWCVHVTMLDGAADALEGFRRSSRVPVSRDELADTLSQIFVDLSVEDATTAAIDLLDGHDIYPKADRRPADSSNGEDRD